MGTALSVTPLTRCGGGRVLQLRLGDQLARDLGQITSSLWSLISGALSDL